MKRRHCTKYVHEGDYIAAVDVDLIDINEGWSPYLSVNDAQKLDYVRDALHRGNLKVAAQYARIYILVPVAL